MSRKATHLKQQPKTKSKLNSCIPVRLGTHAFPNSEQVLCHQKATRPIVTLCLCLQDIVCVNVLNHCTKGVGMVTFETNCVTYIGYTMKGKKGSALGFGDLRYR